VLLDVDMLGAGLQLFVVTESSNNVFGYLVTSKSTITIIDEENKRGKCSSLMQIATIFLLRHDVFTTKSHLKARGSTEPSSGFQP
jgi:hypothetical protein